MPNTVEERSICWIWILIIWYSWLGKHLFSWTWIARAYMDALRNFANLFQKMNKCTQQIFSRVTFCWTQDGVRKNAAVFGSSPCQVRQWKQDVHIEQIQLCFVGHISTSWTKQLNGTRRLLSLKFDQIGQSLCSPVRTTAKCVIWCHSWVVQSGPGSGGFRKFELLLEDLDLFCQTQSDRPLQNLQSSSPLLRCKSNIDLLTTQCWTLVNFQVWCWHVRIFCDSPKSEGKRTNVTTDFYWFVSQLGNGRKIWSFAVVLQTVTVFCKRQRWWEVFWVLLWICLVPMSVGRPCSCRTWSKSTQHCSGKVTSSSSLLST